MTKINEKELNVEKYRDAGDEMMQNLIERYYPEKIRKIKSAEESKLTAQHSMQR